MQTTHQAGSAKLLGFKIVRKPAFHIEILENVQLPQRRIKTNILYNGIDRMPWHDVARAFYAGLLPEHLQETFVSIFDHQNAFRGLLLCQSLEETRQLLDHLNPSQKAQNEIIGVYAGEISGHHDIQSVESTFLGYDYVCLREWSILYAGIFMVPAAFSIWNDCINANGLFVSAEFVDRYAAQYVALSEREIVEPLASDGLDFAAIEVHRISV